MSEINNFRLSANSKKTLIERIENLDVSAHDYSVNVRTWKSKRTLDQNARYWKLVTEFGEYCGYDKEEMHQEVGRRFLSYEKNYQRGALSILLNPQAS